MIDKQCPLGKVGINSVPAMGFLITLLILLRWYHPAPQPMTPKFLSATSTSPLSHRLMYLIVFLVSPRECLISTSNCMWPQQSSCSPLSPLKELPPQLSGLSRWITQCLRPRKQKWSLIRPFLPCSLTNPIASQEGPPVWDVYFSPTSLFKPLPNLPSHLPRVPQ